MVVWVYEKVRDRDTTALVFGLTHRLSRLSHLHFQQSPSPTLAMLCHATATSCLLRPLSPAGRGWTWT